MTNLDRLIALFQSVPPEMRLELLLDYARKLPPLPAEYRAQRDAGLGRVPECMTPVFLFIEANGQVRLHADVAEEAPTVKGFVALLVRAFDGATPAEVAAAPADLLHRLGLADLLRMNRAVGLGAVLGRIKRAVSQAAVVQGQ